MPGESELVTQINASIESMKSTQATLNAELKGLADKAGADAQTAINTCNELASKMQGVAASIVDMEQQLADNVHSGKEAVQTLGQMVIKSDAYKQYASGGSDKMKFNANVIIGQEGSPPTNSDTIVAPHRLPGIVPGAFRLLRIADILPVGTTTSNMVQFTRELAFVNRAAETNEGAVKPQSDLTFELRSLPIATIAHIIHASKQVLEDAPMLASYVDTRMRYGVDAQLDKQLIAGDGLGPNISGILDTGNHTAYIPVAGDNALDTINRAIYKVYESDYAPSGILMNPADWGAIERMKVGSDDERYVIGNPTGIIGPNLWGLPVVLSNNVPAGMFIVAAFDIAYQLWNRTGTVVELFEQNKDNVERNLLTIRAERRGQLATYVPAASQAGNLLATGT